MEAAAGLNPGWRKSSYSSNGGSSCVEVGAIPWRTSTYSSNGGDTCVEVGATPWRKSTYSGNGGDSCVEAGHIPGAVLIRDTTERGQGLVLRVPARAWSRFTAALQEGS